MSTHAALIGLLIGLCATDSGATQEASDARPRFSLAVRIPAAGTQELFEYQLGRDLLLKVRRAVDAQNRHFGWDVSVEDRRLTQSPNFLERLRFHGPQPSNLYAWLFQAGQFPDLLLPVYGYPFELRVRFIDCAVAGGEGTGVRFTRGTIEVSWRRLEESNPVGTSSSGQDARALLKQEPTGLAMRSVEACRIRLNALSNSADFVAHWMYTVTVSADGSVANLRRLDDPMKATRFVELGDFENCVTSWRFAKQGTYRILLHGGSMSSQWFVIVSNGTESMRMRIPRF